MRALGVLEARPAVELLARTAGEERVAAEPDAAARIVELCGGLPLALRVAGARLATRAGWRCRWLADRLQEERRRLDELRVGDLAVRASIDSSYGGLGGLPCLAPRLLAVPGVAEIPGWAAASLLDLPESEAEATLECLADAGLLEIGEADAAGRPRYRLHQLIRAFGRERARDEDDVETRRRAVLPAATAWLGRACQAAASLSPAALPASRRSAPSPLPAAEPDTAVSAGPPAWLEAEEAAMVTVVETAADLGLDRLAAEITGVLTSSRLAIHNRFGSWERTHDVALRAARAARNRRQEATLTAGMGRLRAEQDCFGEAAAWLRAAQKAFAELGDTRAEAAVRIDLGTLFREAGRFAAGSAQLDRAAVLLHAVDAPEEMAHLAYARGTISRERGSDRDALEQLEAALSAFRRLGDARGEGLLLRSIALVHRAGGERLSRSRSLWRELRLSLWEARTARDDGAAQLLVGEHEGAHRTWAWAHAVFVSAGSRDAAELAAWRERWGCRCELAATGRPLRRLGHRTLAPPAGRAEAAGRG